ncbi:MAG: zinc ABC transporter substrate-binding protein, partial [Actinomycetota bacterium]
MAKARSGLWKLFAVLAALVLVAAACGSDDGTTDEANAGQSGDGPTIVVTTNILGDVVGELVGDQANVITIMPVGADPHDFQASAQEVDQLLEADALVVNGTSFEEGLLDVIDSAVEAGVPTFEATSAVQTIEFAEGGHDHGHDDDHEDGEEHSDEEGHDHEDGEEHKDEEGHDHEEGEEHSDEEGHDHEEGEEHSDEEGHDHEEGEEHSDEEGHDH